MIFDSYYWHGAHLSSTELDRARALVATARDRGSFLLLLRSSDVAAQGIAFDQYHYAEASSRHGTTNPFDEYRSEVAARAREVLRMPPSPSTDGVEVGASHTSALGALVNLAGPEDAELIVQALRSSNQSNLRFAAALAARSVLEKSVSPDEQLVTELEKLILDESSDFEDRRAALAALGRARSVPATEALIRALHVSDPSLQASAALHLLDRDLPRYRSRIEEISRAWPKDPPYPADEVLEILAESDRAKE